MGVTRLKVISLNGILLPGFTLSRWRGAVMLQLSLRSQRPHAKTRVLLRRPQWLQVTSLTQSSEARSLRSHIGNGTPVQRYFFCIPLGKQLKLWTTGRSGTCYTGREAMTLV